MQFEGGTKLTARTCCQTMLMHDTVPENVCLVRVIASVCGCSRSSYTTHGKKPDLACMCRYSTLWLGESGGCVSAPWVHGCRYFAGFLLHVLVLESRPLTAYRSPVKRHAAMVIASLPQAGTPRTSDQIAYTDITVHKQRQLDWRQLRIV